MDFTAEQNDIIRAGQGYHLVLATAGAGKTACLTERVAELIRSGVSSRSILAVTFTNKAANEMAERVKAKVGEHETIISTFHSLAFRIIRKHHREMGYNSFEIVNDKYVKSRAIEIYKENFGALGKDEFDEVDDFCQQLSDVKKQYGDPESHFRLEWRELYQRMSKSMKKDGKLTFDDMIFEVCRFFERNEDARIAWASRFKYIMVDECQDTNIAQFKLMYSLDYYGNLMVIGDINQGIMSFQGARVSNITDFDKKHKPNILYLSKNFRSTQRIVGVSNRVLEYSLFDEKMRKPAVAANGEGRLPDFTMYQDEKEQAEAIVNDIQEYADAGLKYSDFTILYRNNILSVGFEKNLIARNIPYVVKSGSFINRREIQLILAALKLGADGYHDEYLNSVTTICRCFNNKIANRILYTVYSQDKGNRTFQQIVRSGDKIPGVGKVRRDGLCELCDFLDRITRLIPKGHMYTEKFALVPLIEEVKDILHRISNEPEEVMMREEGLRIFNEIWQDYFRTSDDKTLNGFINSFYMDYGGTDDKADEEEKDAVVLSTIHSFKGLESGHVYLTFVKDGIFPREVVRNSGEDYIDDICLWYVALSRPKTDLHISSVRYHPIWFYKEDTYSLLQMFLDTGMITGLDGHREEISKKTGFFVPYLSR